MIKKSLPILLGLGSLTALLAVHISPIPVSIVPAAKYKEFTVSQDKGKYQATVQKWAQDGAGEDVLTDTTDVVIYPKVFQAPKKLKVFKKKRGNLVEEGAYKLILKELNVEPKPGEIAIAKVLTLPVFIEPIKISPSIDVECSGGILKMVNTGNVHYKVKSINGKNNLLYILPNQRKEVKNVSGSGSIVTNRGNLSYSCK